MPELRKSDQKCTTGKQWCLRGNMYGLANTVTA